MEIKLTLALPRDEVSVPVIRRTLKASLEVLGIDAGVVSDIELALTEACTNVLKHATGGEEYEVSAGINGTVVHLEKQLTWTPGAVIERLDKGPSRHGPWATDDHLEDAPSPQ